MFERASVKLNLPLSLPRILLPNHEVTLLDKSTVRLPPYLDANVNIKAPFFLGARPTFIGKAFPPAPDFVFLAGAAAYFFIPSPLMVKPAHLGSSPLPQLKETHLTPL